MAFPSTAPEIRSLYRRLLRELPPRPSSTTTSSFAPRPSLLSNRTPVHLRIRDSFEHDSSAPTGTEDELRSGLEVGDQYARYLRAQRLHTTLLERYNPGMNMIEEDRVKMTARRVGMEMPVEVLRAMVGGGKGPGEGGGEGKV